MKPRDLVIVRIDNKYIGTGEILWQHANGKVSVLWHNPVGNIPDLYSDPSDPDPNQRYMSAVDPKHCQVLGFDRAPYKPPTNHNTLAEIIVTVIRAFTFRRK